MDKTRTIYPIKRISIICGDRCKTTISCNIEDLRYSPTKEFKCPVCGNSLEVNFCEALKKAVTYNNAAAEMAEFSRKTGVLFDAE